MLSILFGLVSAFITAVICVVIHSFTRFDFSSFSIFFIIPIGSMTIGTIGCLGHYIYILKANIKTSKATRWVGIVIALICFVAVQYGFYRTAYLDENMNLNYKMQGDHISEYPMDDSNEPMNFITYTKLMINLRTYSFSNKGRQLFEVEGNKIVNWIFFGIDVLGALVGAFIAEAFVIGSKKYCDNCSKYMTKQQLLKFSTSDKDRLLYFKRIAEIEPREIIHLVKGDVAVTGEYYDVSLEHCESCNAGYLHLDYMELDSKNKPKVNEEKSIEIPIDSSITQSIIQSKTTGIA